VRAVLVRCAHRLLSGSSGGRAIGDQERDLDSVCEALAKHAVDVKRSTDNVSVVIAKVVPADRDGGKRGGAYNHQRQQRQGPAGGRQQAPPLAQQRLANGAAVGSQHGSSGGAGRALAAGGGFGHRPAGVPTKGAAVPLDGSMNALGLHRPNPLPKSKLLALDTDEDLMAYLLDDANFG
jgi:hypothetical protein